MKALVFAVAMFALLAPNASAQMQERAADLPTFDNVLERAGLGHLSTEDKQRVQDLLVGMNNATTSESKEKATAFDEVVGYFREQGFSPELVMASLRDGQPILIIGRILRAFTTDIPDSLASGQWQDGVYFVRWTGDGAKEIIVNGAIHDFTGSHWRLF